MTTTSFDYDVMTGRNAGFLTAEEQARLRAAPIFVCGAGGMGGAALQSLVRAGAEHLAVADIDRFELSNLNRQVFSGLSDLGRDKVAATLERLADINPELTVRSYGAEWVDRLDGILADHRIVINAMDDVAAGILLYRRARAAGATVVDAYTSPLPSVTVVRPADPRPEERLGWPTPGRPAAELTPAMIEACRASEIRYVLVHSRSADYIDPDIAAELLAGRRPRPSFAPMVIMTGTLMAYEAIKLAVGRSTGVDHRGRFFDPWRFAVERRRPRPVAALLEWLAKRRIRALREE